MRPRSGTASGTYPSPRCQTPLPRAHVDRCVEIKLRAHYAIEAMLRNCACSMAWSFHAIDATLSPKLHLLDGVEVHEGLRNNSQDNLTHWLISTQRGTSPTARIWLPRAAARPRSAARARAAATLVKTARNSTRRPRRTRPAAKRSRPRVRTASAWNRRRSPTTRSYSRRRSAVSYTYPRRPNTCVEIKLSRRVSATAES